MGGSWSIDLADPALSWCAQRLNLAPAAAQTHLSAFLDQLAGEAARGLGIRLEDNRRGQFARRLQACVFYHWDRLHRAESLDLASVVARIRDGDANLVNDVVLAQAIECNDPRAAKIFDSDFMPAIRLQARRLSGPRGEELVENFVANLVLRESGQAPRIARYQGRTSLANWLRVVTVNYVTSEFRRRAAQPLVADTVAAPAAAETSGGDRQMCHELLSELVRAALDQLTVEDRLLIRLLVLDGVPQSQVARSLDIHSGNVTRRRQKISEAIWQGVQLGARQRGQDRAAKECLELVVAEGDRQLTESLALVLASGLRTSETDRN